MNCDRWHDWQREPFDSWSLDTQLFEDRVMMWTNRSNPNLSQTSRISAVEHEGDGDYGDEHHRRHWYSHNRWVRASTGDSRPYSMGWTRLGSILKRKEWHSRPSWWRMYLVDFWSFFVCSETNAWQWHPSLDHVRSRLHCCLRDAFELHYRCEQCLRVAVDQDTDYRQKPSRGSDKARSVSVTRLSRFDRSDLTSRCSGRKVNRVRFGASKATGEILLLDWDSSRRGTLFGGSQEAVKLANNSTDCCPLPTDRINIDEVFPMNTQTCLNLNISSRHVVSPAANRWNIKLMSFPLLDKRRDTSMNIAHYTCLFLVTQDTARQSIFLFPGRPSNVSGSFAITRTIERFYRSARSVITRNWELKTYLFHRTPLIRSSS